MVVVVPPDARERLRPFFSAMPGLDGCIEAGLSGDFGRAFVDDIDAPSAALLSVDFSFLAGDASRGAELVRSCARPATFRRPQARSAISPSARWAGGAYPIPFPRAAPVPPCRQGIDTQEPISNDNHVVNF